jgi:hypothetical protein
MGRLDVGGSISEIREGARWEERGGAIGGGSQIETEGPVHRRWSCRNALSTSMARSSHFVRSFESQNQVTRRADQALEQSMNS